jgi:uncharacterized membrane protein YgcG
MKTPAAFAAIAALTVVTATMAPAFASRSSYVIDDAHLLSDAAIAQINGQVSTFNAQTGKEVVVISTPSLNGETLAAAEERAFAQQQVNGVMIFLAKAEKLDGVVPDRAGRQFFPPGSTDTIRNAMRPSFRQGNFDEGVETGVGLVINTYRSHESALNRSRRPVGAVSTTNAQRNATGGSGMSWIWWVIILAVAFFIIRGIFRAMSGPRMMGGPGYGGPGYGGPGYGMGGGGGFWSGLLGGLGGAWLGNEIFGGRRDYGGGEAGVGGGNAGSAADSSGFQSDAGQADMGNASSGGFGDSGGASSSGDSGGGWGGGDSGGGGGDSGGGGGGDSGGGW